MRKAFVSLCAGALIATAGIAIASDEPDSALHFECSTFTLGAVMDLGVLRMSGGGSRGAGESDGVHYNSTHLPPGWNPVGGGGTQERSFVVACRETTAWREDRKDSSSPDRQPTARE